MFCTLTFMHCAVDKFQKETKFTKCGAPTKPLTCRITEQASRITLQANGYIRGEASCIIKLSLHRYNLTYPFIRFKDIRKDIALRSLEMIVNENNVSLKSTPIKDIDFYIPTEVSLNLTFLKYYEYYAHLQWTAVGEIVHPSKCCAANN